MLARSFEAYSLNLRVFSMAICTACWSSCARIARCWFRRANHCLCFDMKSLVSRGRVLLSDASFAARCSRDGFSPSASYLEPGPTAHAKGIVIPLSAATRPPALVVGRSHSMTPL